MSPAARAQFINADYYEGVKAKLRAARTEADALACARLVDSDRFGLLPDDAQTELLAMYARLVLASGAGAA